ncbi:MAG: CCA tRNA nucleotidyltransferase [Clostridia bacterium]|nr:CCA tRNA nucleotidyltransferase [Clostridia bacterium]
MQIILPKHLKILSDHCVSPIFIVGGYVRNYLIDGSLSEDIDLAAALSAEELISAAKYCGFTVVAEYKRTGTVVISDGERKYEYTRFRTDFYGAGGGHKPVRSEFTDDITLDAKRRDFKCNAVYYDIKSEKIVDPLCGVNDINDKIIDTVQSPEKVFCSDGLRLIRLARFAAELGFSVRGEVLSKAKEYAENIRDIAPERIFEELKKILVADTKYPFSDKKGHYTGVKILEKIGVFDILFPELALGRGLRQRADFHNYDVLEHSLRTLLYADKSVRLAALLHDVGKPYCKLNSGSYKGHAEAGEIIVKRVLDRLKADKNSIKQAAFLTRWHMFDLKNTETESSLRLFIVKNRKYFSDLLKVKQADFSACKDDLSVSPTVLKWQSVYDKMLKDGTPFSVAELRISAEELIKLGYKKSGIGEELKRLLESAVTEPQINDNAVLKKMAKDDLKRSRT